MEEFVRSPEGLELATLIFDCGYKLADHPRDLTRDQINFLVAALAHRAELVESARLEQEGVTRIVVKED
ncbi:MAG: hypothetical protein H3Z53_02570 [archaeon]|nr:hypothetical protein [archaeon]MCP8313244.1 hypothetical protein [archaeon]MCP8319799.1 hypothetical protein [archaeon]